MILAEEPLPTMTMYLSRIIRDYLRLVNVRLPPTGLSLLSHSWPVELGSTRLYYIALCKISIYDISGYMSKVGIDKIKSLMS
jgi:hypothetical protein